MFLINARQLEHFTTFNLIRKPVSQQPKQCLKDLNVVENRAAGDDHSSHESAENFKKLNEEKVNSCMWNGI